MKLKVISVFLIAVLALVGCGQSSSDSTGTNDASQEEPKQEEVETIVFRLAENQPEDYPTTIGDKEFARLVEERTDGRYKIEVYAGGQLGDERSVIEQIQLGSIDFARVNASPLTEFSKDIGVLSLPYLFDNEEHMWNVLNGEVGDELLATLESSNMIGLAFYDSGKRSFYNSVRPVNGPEDLKGLKIRTQQSQMVIDLVESLGASATPMPFGEVYSGIQTGVIDGAENNFPSYYTTSHYEVANYYTLNAHSTVPEVLMGSSSTWNKLSEEDKQIFREAAKESVQVQREAWKELVDKSRKTIEENGNEIIEVNDFTEWREAVQPYYEKYGTEFTDWIEKIQK